MHAPLGGRSMEADMVHLLKHHNMPVNQLYSLHGFQLGWQTP